MKCGGHVSALSLGNEIDIIFYEDNDGDVKVEVMLQDENIWLYTVALSNLYD